jgi:hypothetical protein
MKKLFISVFLLGAAMLANSQNFEGTLKWSMKSEITDPKMKVQMEEAQKKMADPDTQAQMKEMQEKMNDPQMKAMMDANPQMKAAMENVMKMNQGGGMDMSSMIPTGFIFKVKGGNTLTIVEGGMMPMEVLHLKDQDKTYQLDRKNKTYSEMYNGTGSVDPTDKLQVKVTKTSETTTILNYKCTKYIATVEEDGKTVNQIYWTTTDIKDFDMKSLTKQKIGQGQQILYDGIDGVPLRMEMTMPEARMTMEVTEIKKESLSAAQFTIPSDYKQTEGMFGRP